MNRPNQRTLRTSQTKVLLICLTIQQIIYQKATLEIWQCGQTIVAEQRPQLYFSDLAEPAADKP